MPLNKKAIIRYRILDDCLSNRGRLYTIEDLMDAVNEGLVDFYPHSASVSKRTIYYDLNFMASESGYKAPIEKKKVSSGHVVYYYSDDEFSIFKTALKPFEINLLEDTAQLIHIFSGKPQLDYWQDALLQWKEQNRLSLDMRHPAILFDDNPYLKNRSLLNVLYQYIIEEQPIRIDYQSFTEPRSSFVLHPYLLKEYNKRWFVIGYHTEKDRLYNPAIDRIIDVSPARDIEYRQEEYLDIIDFYDDIVGVTRYDDSSIAEVILEVSSSAAPYILTKPLHASQRSKKLDDGMYKITLHVRPNIELENQILSFGEQVQVLKPASLRIKIMSRLQSAFERYQR